MKISLMATAAIAISVLSACGTDVVDKLDELIISLPVVPENPQVGDTVNNFDRLYEKFGEVQDNLQDIAVEALTDTAEMQGFLGLQFGDGDNSVLIGNASATADFNAGSLNGSASNFAEYEESAACEDGFENCTGTLIQDLNGSLTIDGNIDGVSFDFNTTGIISGDDEDGGFSGDINLNGNGAFGTINDKLVAVGEAKGSAVLTSEEGNLTENMDGLLYLEDPS